MANDSIQFIKNIQEVICLLEHDFENYKHILDQIVGEVVKNPKHTEAYVTFINNQLSNPGTRKKGLILLRFFLPFCTNDILEEEATQWLNNSLKNCKNETTIHDEAYKVIKSLLEICYSSPELNRSVTSGTLSKIVENITKIHYNSNDSINALKCLETCLRIYSGSCLPFKTSIENFILTFVDCSISANVVRLAGRCFHALQQVGGGGTKGINHKEAWKSQQLNLCSTIHSLLDELFESIMELGYVHQENVPILLPTLPTGDSNKLTFIRVINLITFLQEMLLGAFPVPKSVYPKVILNLITRGLSITRATFGDQIINDVLKMSCNLYCIQKQLLQLLQSLIICLGCDLIPYATSVCKLIINNLKLTKPKDAGKVKAFCDLRIMAYQTLSLWITTAKAASCINVFDSYVPAIINDITPHITELNLTAQNTAPKNLSKKAKRKMQHEQISQSGVAKTYSPINKKTIFSSNVYRTKICLEALNIFQIILINCGHQLKLVIHKQLQEFVVKTLFNIQRGNSPSPYDDEQCKMELYKILTTLVTNHHWNMPPPIEYTIQLLSKGQADSNPKIASMCSLAMSNLNSFIHPPFATLQFPLDLENLKNELNLDQEKRIPAPVFEDVESDHEMEVTEIAIKENITNENNKTSEDDNNKIDLTDENNDCGIGNEGNDTEKENYGLNLNKTDTTGKTPDESQENNYFELSDDEVMEPLVIDDDLETSDVIILNDNVEQNNKIIVSQKKKNEDHIDLDEEVMEPLIIDEHSEISEVIKLNDNNAEQNKIIVSPKKKNDNHIDLDEEDMLSTFVDIVN